MARPIYDDVAAAEPEDDGPQMVTIERREIIAQIPYSRYGAGHSILEEAFTAIGKYLPENVTEAGLHLAFELHGQTFSVDVSPSK